MAELFFSVVLAAGHLFSVLLLPPRLIFRYESLSLLQKRGYYSQKVRYYYFYYVYAETQCHQ